jgi:hypothetical protein
MMKEDKKAEDGEKLRRKSRSKTAVKRKWKKKERRGKQKHLAKEKGRGMQK